MSLNKNTHDHASKYARTYICSSNVCSQVHTRAKMRASKFCSHRRLMQRLVYNIDINIIKHILSYVLASTYAYSSRSNTKLVSAWLQCLVYMHASILFFIARRCMHLLRSNLQGQINNTTRAIGRHTMRENSVKILQREHFNILP